jgi:putative transposase
MMTKKRKRGRPEQIVRLLQEGESMLAAGKTAAEVYQKLEVTEATWMRWRKQYGGMKSDEAKCLHELEQENRQLTELLAESELDKQSNHPDGGTSVIFCSSPDQNAASQFVDRLSVLKPISGFR